MRIERDKYHEFIERVARKPMWGMCYCAGGIVVRAGEYGAYYEHADDCIVVEARRLLSLPMDERGNLVEEAQ